MVLLFVVVIISLSSGVMACPVTVVNLRRNSSSHYKVKVEYNKDRHENLSPFLPIPHTL